MTQDEIIEMARQANATEIGHKPPAFHFYLKDLEAFAKLVAEKAHEEFGLPAVGILERTVARAVAKERDACAVIAEELFCGCGRGSCPEGDRRAHDIAESIRARDEA
jgi:hypothetical protein